MALDTNTWQCTCGGRIVFNGTVSIDDGQVTHYVNTCERCRVAYMQMTKSPFYVEPPPVEYPITNAKMYHATNRSPG